MAGGVGQAEGHLELGADAHRARIREKIGLREAIHKGLGALEAEKRRSDAIIQLSDNRSAIRIFELNIKVGPEKA